jgi:hypothetical protein
VKLESGPAKADRNWQLIRTLLFLGFAGWFLYDGAIHWPNLNRQHAAEKLAAPEPFDNAISYDALPATPTKSDFDEFEKTNPTTRDQVVAKDALGEPVHTRHTAGETIDYHASKWGYAAVTYAGNRVKTMSWVKWYKTKDDIRLQFILAIVAAIPGLFFFWRLYKAATLHVVVDDTGMTYDNRRIPFDDMVALRDYNKKGWIDLFYKSGQTERKLRLDNEKVSRFDEIVDAICQAKGFKNEVRQYHADEDIDEDDDSKEEQP